MTIKEAKAIDMVAYLSAAGIDPAQIKGENYWYYSPFRREKTPSFKVDRPRNRWYDFGEGKGGNLIDFILLLEKITIPEALQRLAQVGHLSSPPTALPPNPPSIEILSAHPVTSFALVRYYQSPIAALSSGEVVGVVADNPDLRIPQKMFHGQVRHDFAALKKEEARYEPLPDKQVDEKTIRETFLRVKREAKAIVADEMDRIMNTPGLAGIVVKKD